MTPRFLPLVFAASNLLPFLPPVPFGYVAPPRPNVTPSKRKARKLNAMARKARRRHRA